jgi:hypothetical protein
MEQLFSSSVEAIGGTSSSRRQWAALSSARKIVLVWALLCVIAFGPSLWFGGRLNSCQALVLGHMPQSAFSWAMAEGFWQSAGPVGCYMHVLEAIVSPR